MSNFILSITENDMQRQNEVTLIINMIKATERKIKKNKRDRIYLQAELEELYQDLHMAEVDELCKGISKTTFIGQLSTKRF